MAKSSCRQNAAEYRSLAETASYEEHRSLLLTIASEWEALVDAAARRSKQHADSALHPAYADENRFLLVQEQPTGAEKPGAKINLS